MDFERALREVIRTSPLEVLGERIRAHRVACGVSVRQLAARAMVSKTSIVSLEHGRSCLPATLAKVCAAMNLHVDRLREPAIERQAEAAVMRSEDFRWYDLEATTAGPLADR